MVCNIAKYIIMVMLRLLGVAVIYIIYFFAIEYYKSHWKDCIKFVTMICEQIYLYIKISIYIIFCYM